MLTDYDNYNPLYLNRTTEKYFPCHFDPHSSPVKSKFKLFKIVVTILGF